MFDNKLKIKNVILLLLSAITFLGASYYLYSSYNAMVHYRAVVELMNKNIRFEKESPGIVERYTLIKSIGDRKIINDLEIFHSLGIDKSIKGVTTLLQYQPPLFEGKLFLMGDDIKEVELAIKRLMVKASFLSMTWSNKVYVIEDGDIILKISGDASMMIFEMKDNYLTLSSYVNSQAFEN